MSQVNSVLEHLKNHEEGITTMDAFKLYKVTRLSSIIYILKHSGYNITSELETKKHRGGGHSTYSRYKLV